MSRRALMLLLMVVPLFGALSGCVNCVTGPPVSARQIDSGDATAGVRGYDLRILITDGPGGPPLDGAGVVAYYSNVDAGEWRGPRVDVSAGAGSGSAGTSVSIEPLNDSGTVEAKEVLRMRTGADGIATAHVPGNRIIGIVAAKEGFTEEWVPALAAGATGSGGDVTIPLYRQTLILEVDGVWGPGAVSTGQVTSSQYQWDPRDVPFGETEATTRGYTARIVELGVTLNWTNSPPQAQGDLGIGVGAPDDTPSYFDDNDQNLGTGEQSETTVVSLQDLRDRGILAAPKIQAGAATDTGFLAPFGLPYTMHIVARFDTARAAFASCFGTEDQSDSDGIGAGVPGAVVALAGLAGAALLIRGTRSRNERLR